tara:strand:+ start:225 stop:857 length:633 start_codon:yes stop_codon:yes gene_type:complete
MDEDFEGGSTSLSALMNNNPPPMNTARHMPENTIGQGGPVSMRDVYDKRGGPGNYDMPPPPRQMQNLPPPQQNMQNHTQIRQPPQTMEPPPVIHQPPMMRRPTPPCDHSRVMAREGFQPPGRNMKISKMKKSKGMIEKIKEIFFENLKESMSMMIVLILVQMQNFRSGVSNIIPGSKNPLMFNIIMAILMTMMYQILNKVILKNFKFYAF